MLNTTVKLSEVKAVALDMARAFESKCSTQDCCYIFDWYDNDEEPLPESWTTLTCRSEGPITEEALYERALTLAYTYVCNFRRVSW